MPLAIAAVLAFALALSLLRLFAGPTLHDRALAAKAIVVKAALLCAAAAAAAGQAQWIDAAFALVFGALIVAIAVAKVFRARTFQAPLEPARRR